MKAPEDVNRGTVAIVGGGAAGIFAAVTCAETAPGTRVVVLERGPALLSKVRISGGGRCNVTHACFDVRKLSAFYPRGGQALIGPFHSFQPRHTVEWFAARGVRLKTEPDGRIFPVSDSSNTIMDCLLSSARRAKAELLTSHSVESVAREDGRFRLALASGQTFFCDKLMLATGGCRSPQAGELAVSLGHRLEPPVPSLFGFQLAAPWLRQLAGLSLPAIEVSAPGQRLREEGPAVITHWGISGPAVLKLSSVGARAFSEVSYKFDIRVHWVPRLGVSAIESELQSLRARQPAKLVGNTPLPPLPARLWEALVLQCGIGREVRWAGLSRAAQHALVGQLSATSLPVVGKSLNKDEFVTCGGVRLAEVNFKTMESRICPGLYFGGELLDVDGLTGGFNFQAAWTTGWLAGKAMSDPGPAG